MKLRERELPKVQPQIFYPNQFPPRNTTLPMEKEYRHHSVLDWRER